MSWDWLTAQPIAHRGWHGPGRPENSLAAAEAAAAAGFAVECDIQRSLDGEAIVFHDFGLERLTGTPGLLAARSATELAALRLLGTGEPIPTLARFLTLLAGRVALICEIKSAFDGDMRLAARAVEVVATYPGPLAFKSFDPQVIAYLRALPCPRPLGIVAQANYDEAYFAGLSAEQKRDCAGMGHIGRTQPDFLSWHVEDLPHATPALMRGLAGRPVMSWTVRTPRQWELARLYADQAVFEGAAPSGRADENADHQH